jgi:hypothetical protein
MAKDPGRPPAQSVDNAQLLKAKEEELAKVVDEHDDMVSPRPVILPPLFLTKIV